LRHCDLASRPGAYQFDGSARPVIIGLYFLEKVQHMLCAVGRPYRQQMMIGLLEGAAATHSDEPGISLLWQYHSSVPAHSSINKISDSFL
jgi:hypothetical protein